MKKSDSELAVQLDELERRIDGALELVARLRRENRVLAGKLAEAEQRRQQAIRQLNIILDRIDALL